MGMWLHSADLSGPHPDQSDPRWHVSEQCSDLSHVLVLDDTHSVNPS